MIARGVFTSVPDLKRKLMRYIRQYNKAGQTREVEVLRSHTTDYSRFNRYSPLVMAPPLGGRMDGKWILLISVAWVLGVLFVLILMRMAGDQDRNARRQQKDIDPFAEITVTRPGE